MVRVIVFDYGGVLYQVDTSKMLDFIISTFSLSVDEGRLIRKELRKVVLQGTEEEQFWRDFAKTRGATLEDRWFDTMAKLEREGLKEIPKMQDVVRELQRRGFQTAILSNVGPRYARIVRQLGYYDLFYPVLLSCEMGVEKPDPKAFQLMLERLGCKASSCIFIDDQIENIEAAQSLGIDALYFQSPERLVRDLEKRNVLHRYPPNCLVV
jgi:putative hydrolase of the HAD superfamily